LGGVVFRVNQKASIGDVPVFDISDSCRGSRHVNILETLVTAFYFRRCAASAGAELPDQRGPFFQVFKLIHSQVFVTALGGGNGIGVLEIFERIKSLYVERLRANPRYFLVDIGVEALNERIDDDNRHDPNNHAQQS
jgi:hypothetical protein